MFRDGFDPSSMRLIGRGGFSEIFVGKCNLTGEMVAVKKVKSEDECILN